MMLREQVFAQAALLAGEMESRQLDLLKILCNGATVSLTARLREGLTPEDCKADFIAAASLFALAALNEASEQSSLEEFKAGDLTVKRGNYRDTASRCLQRQGEMILSPYLKDNFTFLGV